MNPPPLRFSLKSDPSCLCDVREQLEKACAEQGYSHECCDQVGLGINEALANVIRHAYTQAPGKPIDMTVEFLPESMEISIRDWGSGYDPTPLLSRPKDPLQPGGLGLILMQQTFDRVQFLPQPDGMVLKLLRKKVQGKR